ncbi:MAG TPA: hypothetical protein VLZ83_07415 [Edaphocola sp.]|nr:hypothetical protein [Edaphocola sp.]
MKQILILIIIPVLISCQTNKTNENDSAFYDDTTNLLRKDSLTKPLKRICAVTMPGISIASRVDLHI